MKQIIAHVAIALCAISVLAGPMPQQRTRIINSAAGTNQLLSTWALSSFTYTNEVIDAVLTGHYEHAPFLRSGDEVQVAGFGTSGTNGIDGKYRVVRLYGSHVQLFRGAYATTNAASVGSGFLTFDQPFTSLSFIGQKAPGTNNTGEVQIGIGTNAVGPLDLSAGGVISVKAEVDALSLTNWSVNAPNNLDGVVIIYFPK